jgi:hypothetical protein
MSLAGLAARDGAALLKQESTVNGQLIIEVSASTGGIHETLVADLELLVDILLRSVQLPAERALPNFYAAFAYGMGWTHWTAFQPAKLAMARWSGEPLYPRVRPVKRPVKDRPQRPKL